MAKYETSAKFAHDFKEFCDTVKSQEGCSLGTSGYPVNIRRMFADSQKVNYNKLFHRRVDEAIKLILRSTNFN